MSKDQILHEESINAVESAEESNIRSMVESAEESNRKSMTESAEESNRKSMTESAGRTAAKSAAKLAIQALENKKAEDIRVIDINQVSVIGDYFILASGSNRSQIQAMSDEVENVLGKNGYPVKQIEGYQTANWILLDFGDVIIHIFDKENRLFYHLERIWRDGKDISLDEL